MHLEYKIMTLLCADFTFIEYMLVGRTLLDHTNFFSSSNYKKRQDNI